MRFKVLEGGGLVGFAGGLVEAEFDNRDIGMRGGEVVVEPGLREVELDLIQGFKRVAEVNEDQVALVAQLREKRGANGEFGIGSFEYLERPCGLGGGALAVGYRSGPPGFPVEVEELMEEAGAFESERNWRELGQGIAFHLNTPSS